MLRTKQEKDALHYRNNVHKIRGQANAYYSENRIDIVSRRRQRDRELKQRVIDAYGGKCACCGESAFEFLTIDHTAGDGHKHRKIVGKGRNVYADLERRGYPKDGYQLLCLNCNISLGFYGYCPHRPNDVRRVDKTPGKITGRVGRRRTVA